MSCAILSSSGTVQSLYLRHIRSDQNHLKQCDAVATLCVSVPHPAVVMFVDSRTSRMDWGLNRELGLMNPIGLQPRHPTLDVPSQWTQMQRLQNAETQTNRNPEDEPEQPSTSKGCKIRMVRICLLNRTSFTPKLIRSLTVLNSSGFSLR